MNDCFVKGFEFPGNGGARQFLKRVWTTDSTPALANPLQLQGQIYGISLGQVAPLNPRKLVSDTAGLY